MLIRLLEGVLRRPRPASDRITSILQRADALESAGKLSEAEAVYREALALDPGNAVGWNNLGWVLQGQERPEAALEAYHAALSLEPGLLIARNNAGTIHRLRGEFDAARAEYETAYRAAPGDALTRINLGTLLLKQGEAESALAHFRDAVALAPQMEEALRALLLALNFLPGVDPAEAFAYYRAWGERCTARVRRRQPQRDWLPERRLRVGYVSPDFRSHAMSNFIEPLLAHHDPAAVEVFCYDNSQAHDTVTARLQGYGANWRAIRGVDDDTVADLVERDRIDILVDLAGHTVGERLDMIARHPAPVQVSFLGYLNTAGLGALDYRVTDSWADPPGTADRYHVERLWRLPGSSLCFRPPDNAPEVAPLPALESGHVTFGSFNNFTKLNHSVTDAWIALLETCAGSRLLLTGAPEGEARAGFAARFAARGIDASRVEFTGRLPLQAFRELHGRVDIALDPFPYAGGATTCESMWMGVPVVTLAGAFGFARTGISLLQGIGLESLVAEDVDEYVEIAARLAADLPSLAQLRQSLRERVRQSQLCDGVRFCKKLEAAYRGMWRERCGLHGVQRHDQPTRTN
jgi:predicted O-linked N-acetylglucosamine transferase (SPINDLY family)